VQSSGNNAHRYSHYEKISSISEIDKSFSSDEAAVITHFLQSRGTVDEQLFTRMLKRTFSNAIYRQILTIGAAIEAPFTPRKKAQFSFIDLFAGIGGMRMAFQNLNGRCAFSSEWDPHSQKTYFENFGEVPFGDVTRISETTIPRHDVLLAGFPCQAFSIAGFKGGFEDTRGTLFFDVARIIASRRPAAFLLENVKGLAGHDKGRTLKIILSTLENDLGYHVAIPEFVNAKNFGVPQNRERIILVGFKDRKSLERFSYPKPTKSNVTIADIKEQEIVSVKYYLSTQYLRTLELHRERHESKGNGFGYQIIPDNGIANAIVVGGMGRERNLLIDKRLRNYTPVTNIQGSVNRSGIRKMTPREWARLQGFPDSFVIPVSDAQAYKQFGNSVAVPAIQAVGKQILKALGYA
jgi:DNA (cytosine-5)-methyltransferase 1